MAPTLKPLTKSQFQSEVRKIREEAKNWVEEELLPWYSKYWSYYNGHVAQKAPKNRSKVVVTELRDAVESAMVSLLRIFLTEDTPARFEPTSMRHVDEAQQKTDTANYVFMTKNNGFRLISDAFRDALVSRIGVFKTYWDESVTIEESEYTNLDENAFLALASDPKVEILEIEDVENEDEAPSLPPEQTLVNLRARITHKSGDIRVDAIPGEEFLIDARAEHPDEALIVGQDGLRRAQDVVNDGIATWQEIERYGTPTTDAHDDASEVRTTRSNIATNRNDEVTTGDDDKATRLIRVSELYVRIDRDRDGVPELHRVIMIGDTVIESEVWDIQPFSVGSPFLRPHTAIGYGLGDLVCELQEVATAVTRSMLDSLYKSVNPRKWAVQGQVNLDDLFRNDFDDVVRVRAPNAVGQLETPFVGKDTLPVLDWVETRKESRTGISRASLGLDPDALQSSTEFGVMSVFTAAQAKVETMARSLGETLVADTYNKIARLLAQHQDAPMMAQLKGNYAEVDPRQWTTDMIVQSTVGIGRGSQIEKTQLLQGVTQKQEELLQLLGPENAIVTVPQYVQALNDLLMTGGVKNPQRYVNSAEQAVQTLQRMAQEPDEPSPEAQQQQAELQLKQQEQQAELQLKQQEQEFEQQLAAEKARFEQELAVWKATQELELQRVEMGIEAELEAFKVATEPVTPGEGELRSPVNGGG